MGLVPFAEGGREGTVFARVGEGNFKEWMGKVAECCTVVGDSFQEEVREREGISALDDVRESIDCGDRPPEGVFKSSKSGSSTKSIPFVSSMGFDLSMTGDCIGVVAVLLRPDILLIISILFFLTIPVLVGPLVGSGGNPHICLATLNSILSFLRKGAFG